MNKPSRLKLRFKIGGIVHQNYLRTGIQALWHGPHLENQYPKMLLYPGRFFFNR